MNIEITFFTKAGIENHMREIDELKLVLIAIHQLLLVKSLEVVDKVRELVGHAIFRVDEPDIDIDLIREDSAIGL